MSGIQDVLKKNLVKERKTKEKEVPLMDILHILATSIADKVTSDGRNMIDSEDEKEINEETEEVIDNLVSETLSSVFGKGDGDDDSSGGNDLKGSDIESESSSRTSNNERELTDDGKGNKEERSLKTTQEDDKPETRKHKSKNTEQATDEQEDGKKSGKEKCK